MTYLLWNETTGDLVRVPDRAPFASPTDVVVARGVTLDEACELASPAPVRVAQAGPVIDPIRRATERNHPLRPTTAGERVS